MCQVCKLTRRQMLKGGAVVAGLAAMAALPATSAWAEEPGVAPNAIAPDAALKRIVDGNARYAANRPSNKDFSAGRAARATAQFPIAGIVSCADSRVAPELLFDQGPGELFVVRLAGNFVNDDGLASLEYGVKILGVPLILVLGHSGCGAIASTIKVIKENVQLPGHLPGLVAALKPAVEAAMAKNPPDLLAEAMAENVRQNVRRLAAAAPIVAPLVETGKVKIAGGVYDIATGKVDLV